MHANIIPDAEVCNESFCPCVLKGVTNRAAKKYLRTTINTFSTEATLRCIEYSSSPFRPASGCTKGFC